MCLLLLFYEMELERKIKMNVMRELKRTHTLVNICRTICELFRFNIVNTAEISFRRLNSKIPLVHRDETKRYTICYYIFGSSYLNADGRKS